MSIGTRAQKLLTHWYRSVLNRMRWLEWLDEHGITRPRTVTPNAPAAVEALEPRLMLTGSMEGSVFYDANRDWLPGVNESGLEGWSVYLDDNANGQWDTEEARTLTDTQGQYAFSNVSAGAHRISLEALSGWRQTTWNAQPWSVNLAEGEQATGLDLGVAVLGQAPMLTQDNEGSGASVSGTLFYDINQDWMRSCEEPFLQNWSVYLDTNGNAAWDSGEAITTTDDEGRFSFTNLPAGQYDVRAEAPAGWRQTTWNGNALELRLSEGQAMGPFHLGLTLSDDVPGVWTLEGVDAVHKALTPSQTVRLTLGSYQGTLDAASPTTKLRMSIFPELTNLAEPMLLGFRVETLSGDLIPAAVQITGLEGATPSIQAEQTNPASSVVVASMAKGQYELEISGELSTASEYRLTTYVVGDVDGDNVVHLADLRAIDAAIGSQQGDANYQLEMDADLDGQITAADFEKAQQNFHKITPALSVEELASGNQNNEEGGEGGGIEGLLLEPVSAGPTTPSSTDEVFYVPGVQAEPTLVTFSWDFGDSEYIDEFGYYFVMNTDGEVSTGYGPDSILGPETVLPWQGGYEFYAMAPGNCQVVFSRDEIATYDTNGDGYPDTTIEKEIALPGNSCIAFYLVQNGTTTQWRETYNEGLDTYNIWFSFQRANVDNEPHFNLAEATDPFYNPGALKQAKIEDLSSILANSQGKTWDGDYDDAVISIALVNDAPTIVVPVSQTIDEDTNLVFSSANGNAITISDADAGDEDVEVTLTVTDGIVTLGSTSGLTSVEGDGTSLVVLTGSINAINLAMEGMSFIPSPDHYGSSNLQIEANDLGHSGGGELTAIDNVSITVNPIPDAPTAVDDDFTIPKNTLRKVFDVISNDMDVDGDSLTITTILLPTHGILERSTDPQTGNDILLYTTTINYVGLDSFTYTIEDSTGKTAQATANIIVHERTLAIDLGSNVVLDEGEMLDRTGTVTGIDTLMPYSVSVDYGDGLTESLEVTDNCFALHHFYETEGSYNVIVTATNYLGYTFTAPLTVTVQNAAPELTVGGNAYIHEGNTFTRVISAYDPGEDDYTVEVQYEAGGTTELLDDNDSGTFVLNHTYTSTGTHTVTVTATDADGGQTIETFDVVVTAQPATGPALNNFTFDAEISEGQALMLNGVFAGSFGSSSPVTVNWGDSQSTTLTMNINGTWDSELLEIWPSHIYAEEGTYTFTVTITDSNSNTLVISDTVEVQNEAPENVQVIGLAACDEGQTVIFQATAEDWDPLTYTWSVTKDASVVATGTGVTFDFTPDDNGQYEITVTANDGDLETTSSVHTLTVNNLAPVIEIEGNLYVQGLEFTHTLQVIDVDTAKNLTADVSYGDGSPTETVAINTDGSCVLSHTYTAEDTYTVSVTVLDGDGGNVTGEFDVEIGPATWPSLEVLEYTELPGEGKDFVIHAEFLCDAVTVTPIVTLIWETGGTPEILAPEFITFDPVTGECSVNASHIFPDDGLYTVSLTIDHEDEYEVPTSATITFDVDVANLPPENLHIDVQTEYPLENELLELTAGATDPGASDYVTYSWTVTRSEDPGYEVTGSGGSFSFTPPDNDTYTFTVIASDGIASATTSKQVVVNNKPPVLEINVSNTNVDEGSFISLSCQKAAGDDPNDTIQRWIINWGDGQKDIVEGTFANRSHYYIVEDPEADTESFRITVEAVDEDGTHCSDDTELITVVNLSPTCPTDVAADVIDGTVYITGKASKRAASHKVYRSEDPGELGVQIGTAANSGGNLTYEDPNMPNGTTYFYTIVATANDEQAISNPAVATTDVTFSEIPIVYIYGNQTVEEGKQYRIALTEFHFYEEGVLKWEIDWGDGTPIEVIDDGPTYSYSYPNSIYAYTEAFHVFDGNESQYTISARAMNANGVYESLNAFDVGVVPAAPLGLAVVADDDEAKIAITWIDNSSVESGYKIYGYENFFNYSFLVDILPANTTQIIYDNLLVGRNYRYLVTAYNDIGESKNISNMAQTCQGSYFTPGMGPGDTTIGPFENISWATSATYLIPENHSSSEGYSIFPNLPGENTSTTSLSSICDNIDYGHQVGSVAYAEDDAIRLGFSTDIENKPGFDLVIFSVSAYCSVYYDDSWIYLNSCRWSSEDKEYGDWSYTNYGCGYEYQIEPDILYATFLDISRVGIEEGESVSYLDLKLFGPIVGVGICYGLSVDLDIDSDNTDGFDPNWERTEYEEYLEYYGFKKIVKVNNNDDDEDGVIDYADFDNSQEMFVPIKLEVPFISNRVYVVFEYNNSDPNNISYKEFDGQQVAIPDKGMIRLWTKDGNQPRSVSDYIRPGEAISLLDIPFDGEIATFWIEGIGETENNNAIRVNICMECDEGLYCCGSDALYIHTYTNVMNAGSSIIAVNDGDRDDVGDNGCAEGDGVPDYANNNVMETWQLVPLTINVPMYSLVDHLLNSTYQPPEPLPVTKFSFNYNASIPSAVSCTSNGYILTDDPDNRIRIWTKWEGAERNSLPLMLGGNFILPNVEYTYEQLGWEESYYNFKVTLYIEAVRPSINMGDISIEIYANASGIDDESYRFKIDECTLTALCACDNSSSRIGVVQSVDGSLIYTDSDYTSGVSIFPFGTTRTWTDQVGLVHNRYSGNGWSNLPYLINAGTTIIAMIDGKPRYYDLINIADDNCECIERYGSKSTLIQKGTSSKYFILHEPDGSEWYFLDYFNDYRKGLAWKYISSGNITTQIDRYDSDSQILSISREDEQYVYAYNTEEEDGPEGLLKSITILRNEGDESTLIQTIEYEYYVEDGDYGLENDLKKVYIKDSSGEIIEAKYYRYEIIENEGEESISKLKMVLGPDACARVTGDLETMSDEALAEYADYVFEYDEQGRVSAQTIQGMGASQFSGDIDLSAGGRMEFEYYDANPAVNGVDYNVWQHRTTVTYSAQESDLSYTMTTYMNFAGMPILTTKQGSGGDVWCTYTEYDDHGRVITVANPSAVDFGSDSDPRLEFVKSGEGLVTHYEYYVESDGEALVGKLKQESISRGYSGTVNPQRFLTYDTTKYEDYNVVVIDTETLYGGQNGDIEINYDYTWYNAQITSITTTRPVTAGAGGSAGSVTYLETFDNYGRPTGSSVDGVTTSSISYSDAYGTVVTETTNGQTITTWHDVLGRPVKIEDPAGHVTNIAYIDTEDISQVWYMPTLGPKQVTVYNRPLARLDTFTIDKNNKITSFTRKHLDYAGRVVAEDQYVRFGYGLEYTSLENLWSAIDTGIQIQKDTQASESSIAFYRTECHYNDLGLQDWVKNAVGTITVTEYDFLGRPTGKKIGTSDSNLKLVESYEYDGGNVGDGNVTKVTQYPSGNSLYNRVATQYYDWRNRLVATRRTGYAMTPVVDVRGYDGLGNVTWEGIWDGSQKLPNANMYGIISGDGLNYDLGGTYWRSVTEYRTDDLGRLYHSTNYGLDYTYNADGEITSADVLENETSITRTWYDSRNRVTKTSTTGQPTHHISYDVSTGHVSREWYTNVSETIIYEEVETDYDANGNAVLETTKMRNHDGSGYQTSYIGHWYNEANQLIATVDYGIDSMPGFGLPDTPPAREKTDGQDTYLVTSYSYYSDGRLRTETDPRGITTAYLEYDGLGRNAVKQEGIGSEDNRVRNTQYTYDGLNHVIEETVYFFVSGSGYETTRYNYGTDGESDIWSNDLLRSIQYPADNQGNSGGLGNFIVMYYNALGEVKARKNKERIKNVYTLDGRGNIISDHPTAICNNTVDPNISFLHYRFDIMGNMTEASTYGGQGADIKINNVERRHNGWGQLISEIQEGVEVVWDEATNRPSWSLIELYSKTINYQYTYDATMGSCLTGMTYPTGLVINYTYDSEGLSRIVEVNGQEEYEYLGLDTVVGRNRNDDLVLKYYSYPGGTLSYTGFDNFGRLVDLEWKYEGVTVDHFMYGYDANGNMLYGENKTNPKWSVLYHKPLEAAATAYDAFNMFNDFYVGELKTSPNASRPNYIEGYPRGESWSLDVFNNSDEYTVDVEGEFVGSQYEYDDGGYPKEYMLNENTHLEDILYDCWNRMTQNSIVDMRYYLSDSRNESQYRVYDALGRTTEVLRIDRIAWDEVDREYNTHVVKEFNTYDSAGHLIAICRDEGESQYDLVSADSYDDLYEQYVWSPVVPNSLISVSRDTDDNGTLDKHLYMTQDVNNSVTTLIYKNSGNISRRFGYKQYGEVFYDGEVSDDPNQMGSSILYRATLYDSTTGLYQISGKEYDPLTGRNLQPDPVATFNAYLSDRDAKTPDATGMEHWLASISGTQAFLGTLAVSVVLAPALMTGSVALVNGIVSTVNTFAQAGFVAGMKGLVAGTAESYITKQAVRAAAQTGVEYAISEISGDKEFNPLSIFAKNFGINMLTGYIGGSVDKAKTFLGAATTGVGKVGENLTYAGVLLDNPTQNYITQMSYKIFASTVSAATYDIVYNQKSPSHALEANLLGTYLSNVFTQGIASPVAHYVDRIGSYSSTTWHYALAPLYNSANKYVNPYYVPFEGILNKANEKSISTVTKRYIYS